MLCTFRALSDRMAPPNDARCQSVMQDVNGSRKHEKLLINKMEFSCDTRSTDLKFLLSYATRDFIVMPLVPIQR